MKNPTKAELTAALTEAHAALLGAAFILARTASHTSDEVLRIELLEEERHYKGKAYEAQRVLLPGSV